MSNRAVIHDSRRVAPAPSTTEPAHIRFARFVSIVLSPPVVSIPFLVLAALYGASNPLAALGYTVLTLLFLSAGPVLYILIGVYTGKISDFDVSVRAQRVQPFLMSIASFLVGLLVLSSLHGPRNLETVLLGAIIGSTIYLIVTLRWKISVHAAAMAGAATMLTALYGVVFVPLFGLLALLGWSRVALGRHTPAQVIGGAALSTVLTVIVLALRGF